MAVSAAASVQSGEVLAIAAATIAAEATAGRSASTAGELRATEGAKSRFTALCIQAVCTHSDGLYTVLVHNLVT